MLVLFSEYLSHRVYMLVLFSEYLSHRVYMLVLFPEYLSHRVYMLVLFSEYLSHRDCFKDTNLHAEGETCNNTLTTSLENIKHSSQGVQYKAKRICQSVYHGYITYFDYVGWFVGV